MQTNQVIGHSLWFHYIPNYLYHHERMRKSFLVENNWAPSAPAAQGHLMGGASIRDIPGQDEEHSEDSLSGINFIPHM